jgi:tetratricopeptide (TPR) repeat protein
MSVAYQDAHAAKLVIAFPERARTFLTQVDPREAATWLNDALVCVSADDFKTRAQLLLLSYEVHKLKRDKDHMRALLNDLEALANRLDDEWLRAKVACLNAECYDMAEDYESQLVWAEQAVALTLRHEDQILIAEAQYQLGFAHIRNFQYTSAEEHLLQSLAIYQETGQRLKEAVVLNGLAANAHYMSNSDDAIRFSEQALAIARELGHRTHELNYLSNLTIFLTGVNDEQVLVYGQQAWTAAREIGHRNAANAAVSALVVTAGSLALDEELDLYVGYAREFLDESPLPYLESLVDNTLAELAYEREDWVKASQMAAQTAATDHSRIDFEREFQSVWVWGNSLAELGRFEEATAALARCLELYQMDPQETLAEDTHQLSGALAALAYVEAQRGNREEGQRMLDEFMAHLAEGGASRIWNTGITLWDAFRAAVLLEDPQITWLKDIIREELDKQISRLTEERLQTAFMSKYTVRSLMEAIAKDR